MMEKKNLLQNSLTGSLVLCFLLTCCIGKTVLAQKNTSDEAITHYNRGVDFNTEGMHQKAIGEYRKALEISPEFVQAHSNLGQSYAEIGKIQEAVGELKIAIKLDPNLLEPYYNLAATYSI
ncbi:MAG: tetratricopeptide repeat protein, partial [Candidatus Omnitrophica bacterium]|nr:tetratricopeptide repeat protein [Candidatus Omnitrophota bacterium]